MNLPNKITISRIFLTFIFMLFLFSKGVMFKALALVTFIIAALSDLLDGYFARKYNVTTDLGKLLDPIADKILVLAAFLAFVELKLVPAWMVLLVIIRELIITSIRILALTKKKVIPASQGGKHKTVSQTVAIIAILSFLVLREVGIKKFGFWTPMFECYFIWLIFTLMLITVSLTLTSGISYLVKNRDIFLSAENN
ncbi:MAG: CDP-diacylglycerol--glycerol-3-phosphate 3-phosphatidyltransferase [Candidatus Omnitrophica bacterium CG07_land_8_20_14_0_80_42_15]|uniref:CDP-diacylglycerol--glycerol-3-phosphate 3-phosphatidyltransferase n=1 Tax=Candidatus Aquitaenariimonas noxiae TaxID=1974741 RepID=A0A2J0KUR4_9BACT|nr:MAG: CDP-diacylglycerol--glycerol-3-phosphate 3-phosphatidyltransferase [Candidatus Omnitrophica bacterium CG07_land_8_20_14_0_80_42_15]